MSEMVLRVARAVQRADHSACESAANGYPDDVSDWDVAIARAAIEAMREPTEAMKNCSDEVHWEYSCAVCGGLAAGYRAMIDAALSSGEGKT